MQGFDDPPPIYLFIYTKIFTSMIARAHVVHTWGGLVNVG